MLRPSAEREPHHASEALREGLRVRWQFSVENSRFIVEQVRGVFPEGAILISDGR
jgi:hypothetical protein